jgi:hypothetical protein
MDQMAALRELAADGVKISSSSAYLFKPGETFALKQGGMNGTPLPHEEPQGSNPPAGVVAYYWLKSGATQPLKLELLDGNGGVRACLASDTPVKQPDTETLNVQAVWEQPVPPPSASAGMHRVSLGAAAGRGGFGGGRGGAAPAPKDACLPQGGPAAAAGGRGGRGGGGRRGGGGLQPGQYSVRLTVNGQVLTQPVMLKPDPRGVPNGLSN